MSQGGPTTRERLRAILEAQSLTVHFQPIVDLHDGLIIAYEALTRVPPGCGFAHAGELFAAASEEHLLWELETQTRRNAIRTAAGWPRHTRLFLNSTPVVFADSRFAAQLAADMESAPDLRPERLVLEITELSEDQYIPGMTEQVRALTAAGFNVALDDAGAGASGLNRMMSLRPHWVKLDREFVRDIGSDMLRQNLVRFFVHFARLSGVSVVAEGIETAEELQTVTSLGVRFAQGFYLGRPGTREQTMDPAFVAAVRARWAAVEAAVPHEMLEPTLGAICRSVGIAEGSTTVREALAIAARHPEVSGVLVAGGPHGQGWAPLALLSSLDPEAPLLAYAGGFGQFAPLNANLTVNEAVTALCTRDDDRVADPIAVAEGDTLLGVVRLRDLLRVAAGEGRLIASGRTRMTGLPTRVRADQHMTALLAEAKSSSVGVDFHTDAAFVDVRAFAEFNSRFGSGKGDSLIRELAELISAVVISAVHDAFIAHLGDDRFILTGASGSLLPHLHKLAVAFDEQRAELEDAASTASLRILHLPGAFLEVQHPRDIYRLEQQIREQTRERDASACTGSYVFVHGESRPKRQAA